MTKIFRGLNHFAHSLYASTDCSAGVRLLSGILGLLSEVTSYPCGLRFEREILYVPGVFLTFWVHLLDWFLFVVDHLLALEHLFLYFSATSLPQDNTIL